MTSASEDHDNWRESARPFSSSTIQEEFIGYSVPSKRKDYDSWPNSGFCPIFPSNTLKTGESLFSRPPSATGPSATGALEARIANLEDALDKKIKECEELKPRLKRLEDDCEEFKARLKSLESGD